MKSKDLNKLMINKYHLKNAIQAAIQATGSSYHEAKTVDHWYSSDHETSESIRHVANSGIRSMMRDLRHLNEHIRSELDKPEQSGKILHIHASKIMQEASHYTRDLHANYATEVSIGTKPDAVIDSSSSRWHKQVNITVKLTWNANVLKAGVAPIVNWKNKPTFVLDAKRVDLSHRDDLDPCIEVFQVNTLQIFRDTSSTSYNPDPRFEIKEAWYSHLRGTDGKCIEPAISVSENWAIRVANQRTSKNILSTFL